MGWKGESWSNAWLLTGWWFIKDGMNLMGRKGESLNNVGLLTGVVAYKRRNVSHGVER